MLIHSVFFYAKPGLSSDELAAWRRGLESLCSIASVERAYIGTPAPTERRPVIDASYAFALTVLFRDVTAHDAYQTDPIHLKFIEDCRRYWERVQIYDAA